MNCKEDLIGAEWTCSYCNKQVTIKKCGIIHGDLTHDVFIPLFKLFELRKKWEMNNNIENNGE